MYQSKSKLIRTTLFCLLAFGCRIAAAQLAGDVDELAGSSSWNLPDNATVEAAISSWLQDTGADELTRENAVTGYRRVATSSNERLDPILSALASVRPELSELIEAASQDSTALRIPDFNPLINAEDQHPFVHNHLRLLAGRWCARNELYDEANDYLSGLSPDSVSAPATLLFYQLISQHQLLMKEECIESASLLLENAEHLPRRFRVVSELILADIETLEDGSLDEIARMMADIRRRQSLYRSGTTVRRQEQQVIQKLDQLIEDLESQKQQQQQSASSQSSSPMQDSRNAGGQGDGEITRRDLEDGGQWGDLPPEQRAAALADMSRDLPPHYRTVIEEYFRQLARENDER